MNKAKGKRFWRESRQRHEQGSVTNSLRSQMCALVTPICLRSRHCMAYMVMLCHVWMRRPIEKQWHAILRPRCSTVWESSWSCLMNNWRAKSLACVRCGFEQSIFFGWDGAWLHRGPMSKSNHQKKPATVLPRKRLATHWLTSFGTACLTDEYIYIYYRWNYLEFPFQSLKRSQMDLNGKLNGTPTLMSFDLGCLNLLEGQ